MILFVVLRHHYHHHHRHHHHFCTAHKVWSLRALSRLKPKYSFGKWWKWKISLMGIVHKSCMSSQSPVNEGTYLQGHLALFKFSFFIFILTSKWLNILFCIVNTNTFVLFYPKMEWINELNLFVQNNFRRKLHKTNIIGMPPIILP